MHTTSISFILSALFLLTSPAKAVVNYDKGDKLNVLALSGLRLRATPGGAVLGSIPYGAQVTMLEGISDTPGRSDKVENISGHWARVSWNNQEGFVFDGFLSFLPAPSEDITEYEAYADKYFQKKGPAIEFDNGGEDSHHAIEIRGYVYRNAMIEVRSDVYYENFRSLMVFGDGVSPEEAFLLAQALFRKRIEDGIAKGQKGEFSLTPDDSMPANQKPGKSYYKFMGPEFTYELPAECAFEEFGIGYFEGLLYLSRAGGC